MNASSSFEPIWQQLEAYCAQDDYAGWDPFDGLNSQLLQATRLDKNAFFRLVWLQLFKRSPINFRRVAGVPKMHNAKALSLFARGYLARGEHGKAQALLTKMLDLRVDHTIWGQGAWGYPFDWQAKAFFVDAQTPNVICTAYCVKALHDFSGLRAGADVAPAHASEYEPMIVGAAEFVFEHLLRTHESGATYLAYVPGSDAVVYNAALWGAYILLLGDAVKPNEAWRMAAQDTIAFVVANQAVDGSWLYGEAPHHQFIDGFHTGYNLEVLDLCQQQLGTDLYDTVIQRGMAYYQAQLIDAQGCAKYYHDNPYPIDCHSAAQAVLTLLTVNSNATQTALAEKIMHWTVEQMWDPKHSQFFYQKGRYVTNKIPYLRWTQAWMFLALSKLL